MHKVEAYHDPFTLSALYEINEQEKVTIFIGKWKQKSNNIYQPSMKGMNKKSNKKKKTTLEICIDREHIPAS
jgi:hypothetical protein